MRKEDQRHLKLNEVYKQLTAIKNQLQALIQPSTQPEYLKAIPRHELIPQINTKVQQKMNNQPLNNVESKKQKQKQSEENQMLLQKDLKDTHMRSLGSPPKDFYQKKIINLQNQKKCFEQVIGKKNHDKEANKFNRFGQETELIPKISFNSQQKEHQSIEHHTPEHFSKNPHPNRRKFTHTRHATQFQFKKQDPTNQKIERIPTQNGPTVEKTNKAKYFIAFRKKQDGAKEGNKSLTRMRSDFTTSEKDQDLKMIYSARSKELQLEAQLNKKSESMNFMMTELQEIQKNFKQLQGNLVKILNHHDKFNGKLTDIDVNSALIDIIQKLEHQTNQLARLNQECLKLQQLSNQQQQKIKLLQQTVSQNDKTILQLSKQQQRYTCQLMALSSKLEVAVGENKVKDQFIVKLLSTRNQFLEQSVSSRVSQTLQQYLSQCGYPSNRLLQKLREQQSEIHRLQALLNQK